MALAALGLLAACAQDPLAGAANETGEGDPSGLAEPALPLLLTLSPAAATLQVGARLTLTVTATFEDGTTGLLTSGLDWSSSDDAVATVSAAGVVTAESLGTATLTATFHDSAISGSATVTVAPALVGLSLTPATVTLAVGATAGLALTAAYSDGTSAPLTDGVAWSSSDGAVAEVGAAGEVTAIAPGVATITATASPSGLSAAAEVTVSVAEAADNDEEESAPAIVGLALTPDAAELAPDEAVTLTVTATYDDGSSAAVTSGLTWSSSDEGVAEVSGAGVVTAVAFGEAVVSAASGGLSADAAITVLAVLESISLAQDEVTLREGLTESLTVTGHYSDGQELTLGDGVDWSTSAPEVATVAGDGTVTAVAIGTATITATVGVFADDLAVTVLPALVTLAITPADTTIERTLTFQLTATATYSDDSSADVTAEVALESSDEAVAVVSAAGVVTAVGVGTATLIATDSDTAIEGEADVTVEPALASIALTPPAATVQVGGTRQFSAVGTFEGGATADVGARVTWSSADEAIATVDDAGLITGVSEGLVGFTATDILHPVSADVEAWVTPSAAGLTYYATTKIVTEGEEELDPVESDFALLQVDIPESPAAVGIVVAGSASLRQFVDRGIWGCLTEDDPCPDEELAYITDPDGDPVLLSFSLVDGVPVPAYLSDFHATAVFFPTDGTVGGLSTGTYSFPIGALGPGNQLTVDTLQPYVFYKSVAEGPTTLKLNVFLVTGVGGLTTLEEAQADPELTHALEILRDVFQRNGYAALAVEIDLQMIEDASYAILESSSEWDTLNSSYPASPTHDAQNIFIVSSMDFTTPGVVGLAPRIPGPFNLQGTIQSGTLAEYIGDGEGLILGVILAHEFGHFMGLWHTSQTNSARDDIVASDPIADTPLCTTEEVVVGLTNCPDATNVMFPILTGVTQTQISAGQGNVIRLNPAVGAD